ncbi:hypothetical protein [Clavibacter zhangzhiyongii]|uniref:Uncharacterized protein n=1 Tax=Clavibacter zhangzhiyongii TaxID=2768071 RepID=A0A7L7Z3P2_9MICO|nr:hypothetical protein [Clavibacter zhangzhiyongii]QOD44291.1 hypothetical protein H9X71_02765 [Clavibacter zhangzhiyongii]
MPAQDAYLRRLETLLHAIEGIDGVTDEGKRLATQAVQRVLETWTNDPFLLESSDTMPSFWDEADEVLAALPNVPSDEPAALHAWARNLTFKLINQVDSYIEYDEGSPRQRASAFDLQRNLASDIQDIATSETGERMQARADKVLAGIENTERSVQVAAGNVGGTKLFEYFGDYADSQLKAANFFRWATILLISAGGIVSLALPLPGRADWATVAARLSVLAAVVGLAAYCGRQSTHHRRIADWARALEVQLKSLPAFIEPIQADEQRDGIYAAFARRILGNPPDGSSANSDTTELSMTQVIDLLSVVIKKA